MSDAAQGPNIALEVIGFVAPNFGTSIVWRARLGVVETVLTRQFRYVEVSDLHDVVIRQKNVRRLSKKKYDHHGWR